METEKKYPVEIIKAIHEVKSKVQYVKKDGKNEFHGYKYASEAALINALHPAIQEAGLVILPSGEELLPPDDHGNTHVVMLYTLTHTSGAVWPEKLRFYGSGGDKSSKGTVGDKGCYKALTGVNKYFLRQLFQIETGNDAEKMNKAEKEEKEEREKNKSNTTTNARGVEGRKVTEAQLKRLRAIAGDFEWENDAVKKLIQSYGYESSRDIESWEDYGAIIKDLQKGQDGKAKANAEGYCIFANGEAKEPKK